MAMRIALLTYSTQPRGSVVHTLELAAALTDLGHAVWVYALDKDGRGFGRSRCHAVQLVPTQPAPESIDALIQQRIQEFVTHFTQDTRRFDIYHAQDCIGANALLHLRERGQIPHLVRTVHHVEDYVSPYLQACQDRSIRQPDLCFCVSDRWQQALQQDYGLTAPRVFNGVDTVRFSPLSSGREVALKQRYGITGSPVFLTVGGIEPRKNSIRLLQAFAQARQTLPQAQLVIAGGATLFDYRPYREEFFQMAAQLGMETGRDLILPGIIPDEDLPDLYRCGDGFCLPSVKEGWGLVVLEAIAAGLPIVTARQPPFTEFLSDRSAFLVDPTSVSSIAQGLVAAADPAQAQPRLQQSQTILPQYTWARSAQLHLQHYGTLTAATVNP